MVYQLNWDHNLLKEIANNKNIKIFANGNGLPTELGP